LSRWKWTLPENASEPRRFEMANAVGLRPIGEADLVVANRKQDIRGREVVDSRGVTLGTVDDLFVDADGSHVRFLKVRSGGFLGIGETTMLLPAEAVREFDEHHVYVTRDRETIAGGPRYDPALEHHQDYWEDFYRYYGFGPPWTSVLYPPPIPDNSSRPTVEQQQEDGA